MSRSTAGVHRPPGGALNLDDNADTETQCATLDEALTHLRELVLNEIADPDGPIFDRYGLYFDARLRQIQSRQSK